MLLGAGGAARAIGVEIALAGAKHVTVVNRDPERGKVLTDLLNEKTPTDASYVQWQGNFSIPNGTDVLINATSIGLFPDVDARVPINPDSLTSNMVVADVIFNPPRTWLIREAEQRDCVAIDGLGMLVNQGVIGIKYWTGVDVEPAVMRSTLEKIFSHSLRV